MIFGWMFIIIGLFILVLYLSVGFLFVSYREDIAAEIGTTWQRIAGGSLLVAGLSATLSPFSLAIAIFSETTVTKPLGATVFGIPFANLSTYFLQVTIPSMGVGILAVIVGFVMNQR